MKISVSFLKSNHHLATTLEQIANSKADSIHVDVMDGLFVTTKTDFTKEKLELLKQNKKPKEVHLMTLHLKNYIDFFASIHPECIIFPYEATTNVEEIIQYIKEKGIKVGIALNPFSDVLLIAPFMHTIDEVVIMSVIPGYGGQKFLPVAIEKINQLYELREKNKAHFLINVDGGIDDQTIQFIASKVDMAVSGSYVLNGMDINLQIDKLKKKNFICE